MKTEAKEAGYDIRRLLNRISSNLRTCAHVQTPKVAQLMRDFSSEIQCAVEMEERFEALIAPAIKYYEIELAHQGDPE